MAYTPRSTQDEDVEEASPEETKGTERPIDTLVPKSDKHTKLLEYLKDRLKYSEISMSKFYDRWQVNEKKIQAYIDLPKYDEILREMNKSGLPPNPISVIVPYSFATVWTIVTYHMHTFCGRKPIFQVASYQAEMTQAAKNMETMLQYNADHTRLVKQLIQFFLDSSIYGVGIIRALWNVERKKRTIWVDQAPLGLVAPNGTPIQTRQSQERLVYEGNECESIDPFMFFPDPRVPMTEVNKRGEFVFWRSYTGEFTLKKAEQQGKLRWTDHMGTMPVNTNKGSSSRNSLSGGEATPGASRGDANSTLATPFHQIDQGTVEIIPSQFGLGDGQYPEKWLFSIANKQQIIQAEPFDADHDRHPVAVIEPHSFGYGFGQPGISDFLAPIQDSLSWFMNSHIHNVRSVMNNSLVYDPSMIEEQDLKNPKPGKLIRLKRSAYGQDVKTALQQLNVVDVTRGNIDDMQAFMRIGDSLSAVNDNLRGIQEAGGRKTATEVRTAGEAGASRLAAQSRLISAQGLVDLSEMMSVNIQQHQTMEFYLQVVGAQEMGKGPQPITPQSLAGDFYFPVHDGTLPLDRVALFDVWKEIMMAIMQSEALQAQFPLGEIFKHVSELGGAPDLANYEVKVAPPTGAELGQGSNQGQPNGVGPLPPEGP
jgi:hypothetical protein